MLGFRDESIYLKRKKKKVPEKYIFLLLLYIVYSGYKYEIVS